MKKQYLRKCEICGDLFTTSDKNQMDCSEECYEAFQAELDDMECQHHDEEQEAMDDAFWAQQQAMAQRARCLAELADDHLCA